MAFGNPIIGGGGVLVRREIRSPDFVAGVSGWIIRRDGTAEFNDAVFRGSIVVTDPDGSAVKILAGNGGTIDFEPADTVGVTKLQDGQIFTGISGTNVSAFMVLSTPAIEVGGNDVIPGQLFISTERTDGVPFTGFSVPDRMVEIPGQLLVQGEELHNGYTTTVGEATFLAEVNDGLGQIYLRGQRRTELISFAAAVSFTQAIAFTTPFPVGVVPNVHVNINSNAGVTRFWTVRAYGISNTGFTLWCANTDLARAAEAWVNVAVQWSALID